MRQFRGFIHLGRNGIHMPFWNAMVLGILSIVLFACQPAEPGEPGSRQKAISSANEVVVICDAEIWQSHVRDTIEYYFEAPYPIMPQPEPIFDLRHFTTEDLQANSLRRELRTYVVVANLNDEDSETTRLTNADLGQEKLRRAREDQSYFTSVGRDKWAREQLVIYVFGFSVDDIASKIVKAYPAIANRIHEHDRPLIDAATYLNEESYQINKRINEKFGIDLKVPGDYHTAIDKDNFIWIRQDFDAAISNIIVMRFPYESQDQFLKEGIITMRDRMGLMVEGSSLGSYMVTNHEDLPIYLYKKEIDGHYAIESRGIWELTEDFLGGPFVNYAILDSTSILMIDAFVHAPTEEKRNFVQRLEHIISSLRFVK